MAGVIVVAMVLFQNTDLGRNQHLKLRWGKLGEIDFAEDGRFEAAPGTEHGKV